jgi:hypothetical protein
MHMVNDSRILVVSWAGSNNIWGAPQSVLMNSGAQPVVIGKRLAMSYGQ